MCYDFNIDTGGGGDIASEGRRTARIIEALTVFPNFGNNFCPAFWQTFSPLQFLVVGRRSRSLTDDYAKDGVPRAV